MYKLIIGNTRVTVHDDTISRMAAVAAAQEAVQSAARSGKQLSQIDIQQTADGLHVDTVEKSGIRSCRKTVKQSMIDCIITSASETLCANGTSSDNWLDPDSGQQWHGSEVETVRKQLLASLDAWSKQN